MAKKKTTLRSFEEVQQLLYKAAKLKLRIQKHEASMNKDIERIKQRYADVLRDDSDSLLGIEENIKLFAIQNRSEFQKSRSKNLLHAFIGFRYGKEAIKLMSKCTEDEALAALEEVYGDDYIRIIKEIDRNKLLSDSSGLEPKLSAADLAEVHLRRHQSETFFIEYNFESIDEPESISK